MSNFVRQPLEKKLNRQNVVKRIENLEGKTSARASLRTINLGNVTDEISGVTFYAVDPNSGQIRMVMSGNNLIDLIGVSSHLAGLDTAGVPTFYVDADTGALTAGAGTLDADGISIIVSKDYATTRSLKFKYNGLIRTEFYTTIPTEWDTYTVFQNQYNVNNGHAQFYLTQTGGYAKKGEIHLNAFNLDSAGASLDLTQTAAGVGDATLTAANTIHLTTPVTTISGILGITGTVNANAGLTTFGGLVQINGSYQDFDTTINGDTTTIATFDAGLEKAIITNLDVTGTLNATGVIGYWNSVPKTADESRQSDTVFTADGELLFNAFPNGVYEVRGKVWFNTSAAADFKYRFKFLGTAIYVKHTAYPAGSAVGTTQIDTATSAGQSVLGTGTTAGFIEFDARILCDASYRVFEFQWAQDTSTASNTTVLSGSYLEYMKVA